MCFVLPRALATSASPSIFVTLDTRALPIAPGKEKVTGFSTCVAVSRAHDEWSRDSNVPAVFHADVPSAAGAAVAVVPATIALGVISPISALVRSSISLLKNVVFRPSEVVLYPLVMMIVCVDGSGWVADGCVLEC